MHDLNMIPKSNHIKTVTISTSGTAIKYTVAER